MPHRFKSVGSCKECGKDEVISYDRLCASCLQRRMEKKKKAYIYSCIICGIQWNSQRRPPDILAETISDHMKSSHNDLFIKKVLTGFVKQYKYRISDESSVIVTT